jgi:hypothetical protein
MKSRNATSAGVAWICLFLPRGSFLIPPDLRVRLFSAKVLLRYASIFAFVSVLILSMNSVFIFQKKNLPLRFFFPLRAVARGESMHFIGNIRV